MKNQKEKAKELCLKFERLLFINVSDKAEDIDFISKDSKKCAHIAVDEVLDIFPKQGIQYILQKETIQFWNEVKAEIDKL